MYREVERYRKSAFKTIKKLFNTLTLYTNIDQTLLNKLHGPMHCKIGGTCVYSGHVFYTLLY